MIAKIGTEKREKITFEEMSEVLIDAIECKDTFYFRKSSSFKVIYFEIPIFDTTECNYCLLEVRCEFY